MRKILSERNLVVFLFVMAFVVFTFAQEDAKKLEKMYQESGNKVSANVISTPSSAPVRVIHE